MKHYFAFLMWMCSISAFSTTYYVSNAGSDDYAGTSTSEPWQTLDKVNTAFFLPGDKVMFKRGDIFYGSIIINGSGRLGEFITYGAYGKGDNPIITGFKKVTQWVKLSHNIWESAEVVSKLPVCNMVTINNINVPMGRYPNRTDSNGGFLFFQSHNGNTSLNSSSLSDSINWIGAEVVIKTNVYILDRRRIISQEGRTLKWLNAISFDLMNDYGFFIQNDSRTLDLQNEWYYNPTNKKLQICSVLPPEDIKVSSINTLITCNQSYIVVRDLSLTGANQYAIYNSSSKNYVIIKNCQIAFSGSYGISLSGVNYAFIDSCNLDRINDIGISLGTSNNHGKITNNIITNVGTCPGMGYRGNYSGIAASNHIGLQIKYNVIRNIGFNPITVWGDSILIKNNLIDTFNTILQDGGGVYVGRESSPYGTEINGNIVLHGIGCTLGTPLKNIQSIGIYVDVLTKGYRILNNTVAYVGNSGIMVSGCYQTKVEGNTVYDCAFGLTWNSGEGKQPFKVRNNTVKYNTFICTKSKGNFRAVKYSTYTWNFNDSIPFFADFDYNVYGKPLNDHTQKARWEAMAEISNTLGPDFMTLEQWQAFSHQDLHSIVPPQGIVDSNHMKLFYNECGSPKRIKLNYPVIDVKGNKYNSYVDLEPFTSIVLMKDYNFSAKDK